MGNRYAKEARREALRRQKRWGATLRSDQGSQFTCVCCCDLRRISSVTGGLPPLFCRDLSLSAALPAVAG